MVCLIKLIAIKASSICLYAVANMLHSLESKQAFLCIDGTHPLFCMIKSATDEALAINGCRHSA